MKLRRITDYLILREGVKKLDFLGDMSPMFSTKPFNTIPRYSMPRLGVLYCYNIGSVLLLLQYFYF